MEHERSHNKERDRERKREVGMGPATSLLNSGDRKLKITHSPVRFNPCVQWTPTSLSVNIVCKFPILYERERERHERRKKEDISNVMKNYRSRGDGKVQKEKKGRRKSNKSRTYRVAVWWNHALFGRNLRAACSSAQRDLEKKSTTPSHRFDDIRKKRKFSKNKIASP